MQNKHDAPSMDPNGESILVCWIGNTDLLSFGRFGLDCGNIDLTSLAMKILHEDGKGDCEQIRERIKHLDLETQDSSIALTLNKAGKDGFPTFNRVILLTNRPSALADKDSRSQLEDFEERYPTFLRMKCNFNGEVEILFVSDGQDENRGVNPWDYQKTYDATNRALGARLASFPNAICYYNITPGTIAQSTTLILFGKERVRSSKFIQVNKAAQHVEICPIPFNWQNAIRELGSPIESKGVVGNAPSFRSALNKAKRVAPYSVDILLTGESGTGKEVIARTIHEASGRTGAFVAINCAMLPKEIGITELTGYMAGAFTGALNRTMKGKFDEAKGGTLFLDEIGDCPLNIQAELLRFLQPPDLKNPSMRIWRRFGSNGEECQGDIRVIAATNVDVRDASKFRQDLYYRISAIQIHLPSLEERKHETSVDDGVDDIKDLSDYFLKNFNEIHGTGKRFSEDAYEALRNHEWTGNVRELKNTILRVALLTDGNGDVITRGDVQENLDLNNENPVRRNVYDVKMDGSRNTGARKDALLERLKTTVAELAEQDAQNGDASFKDRELTFGQIYCAAMMKSLKTRKNVCAKLGMNARTLNKYLVPPPAPTSEAPLQ